MKEAKTTPCVLIPCSGTENWAVPQACLAEIQVVNSESESPPEKVLWRGCEVPVLDLGGEDDAPWSGRRVGTGLVAIFLGTQGSGREYWAVAVRGQGLAIATPSQDEVADASKEALAHAKSAFTYNDVLYQVPDLDGLQKRFDAGTDAA